MLKSDLDLHDFACRMSCRVRVQTLRSATVRVVNIADKRAIIKGMMLRGAPVSHLSKTEVHERMETSHWTSRGKVLACMCHLNN
jgi:hypothetical protein